MTTDLVAVAVDATPTPSRWPLYAGAPAAASIKFTGVVVFMGVLSHDEETCKGMRGHVITR